MSKLENKKGEHFFKYLISERHYRYQSVAAVYINICKYIIFVKYRNIITIYGAKDIVQIYKLGDFYKFRFLAQHSLQTFYFLLFGLKYDS